MLKAQKSQSGAFHFISRLFSFLFFSSFLISFAYAADNAVFVSQSVPTTMTAGQSYNVSVTMKNTGTTTWKSSTNYKLGSQNPPDNKTWGMSRVVLSGSDSIAPNQNKTFSFTVVAPPAGKYNFQWKMLREGVAWFGAASTNVSVTTSGGGGGGGLQVGTISPSSGSSAFNQQVLFTTTFSHSSGVKNIKQVSFLVDSSTDGVNAFYATYSRKKNLLYLRNDAGTKNTGGIVPGTSKILENSYAKLNCASTAVNASGNTLTVTWAATFKNTFAGSQTMYLLAQDMSGNTVGFTPLGTWTVGSTTLSVSVNPKTWQIGTMSPGTTQTMTSGSKITVTNDGSATETLSLNLTNPSGWTASTAPGAEIYVLNGILCNVNDVPGASQFNQDAGTEDVITTGSKKSTTTTFAYSGATANGTSIGASAQRALYLQFKSPTATQQKNEQSISVIVTAQTP